jgi:hypothetical protein
LLIVINLLLGFGGTISFMGHFSWAVAGGIFAWFKNKHPHFKFPNLRR